MFVRFPQEVEALKAALKEQGNIAVVEDIEMKRIFMG